VREREREKKIERERERKTEREKERKTEREKARERKREAAQVNRFHLCRLVCEDTKSEGAGGRERESERAREC